MASGNNNPTGIHPEMLVGLSAVLIGVCALAVSLYETKLMREEQRAAVIPLMELARSFYVDKNATTPDKWRLSLHAENVGIGPARVRDFRVTVDGRPHPTWGSAMEALLRGEREIDYGQSTINGRTIPPDRIVTMFELSGEELVADILREFERLDFSACYCSVFDECWTTSYKVFGAATPVETCHTTDQSFQE